jgi:hypothetical protein
METEESGGIIMSVQDVKKLTEEELQEIRDEAEYTKDYSKRSRSILKLLSHIEQQEIRRKKWKSADDKYYEQLRNSIDYWETKAQRLEEALKEIRKGKMSYSQMVILADTVIDKELKGE